MTCNNIFADAFTDADGALLSAHVPDLAPVGWGWQVGTPLEILGNAVAVPTDYDPLFDSAYADLSPTVLGSLLPLAFPYRVTITASVDQAVMNGFQTNFCLQGDSGTSNAVWVGFDASNAYAQVSVDDVIYTNQTAVSTLEEHTVEVLIEADQFTLTVDGVELPPVSCTCPIAFTYAQLTVTRGVTSVSALAVCNLVTKGGFALDMKPNGFGLVPLAFHPTAVYADPVTDNLYLLLDNVSEPTDGLLPLPSTAPVPDGRTIYQFNADTDSEMVYRWRSKLYVLPVPVSFIRVQVRATTYLNTVFRAYKQVLTAGAWVDTLIREVVVSSDEPFNLPVGTDYNRFWWEVLSTDPIQSVQVAESIDELT